MLRLPKELKESYHIEKETQDLHNYLYLRNIRNNSLKRFYLSI